MNFDALVIQSRSITVELVLAGSGNQTSPGADRADVSGSVIIFLALLVKTPSKVPSANESDSQVCGH